MKSELRDNLKRFVAALTAILIVAGTGLPAPGGVWLFDTAITEQGIPTPTAYALSQGRDNGRHNAKTYRWGAATVTNILERLEYCGHTVNFRTHMKSYKVHKIVYNPQDEWQIFENTQEPIITLWCGGIDYLCGNGQIWKKDFITDALCGLI